MTESQHKERCKGDLAICTNAEGDIVKRSCYLCEVEIDAALTNSCP